MRNLARQQIDGYGSVAFSGARVTNLTPGNDGAGFCVHTEAGKTHEARLVLLAPGLVDVYPDIEGFDHFWGHRVIHCAFCHGRENSGRRWGVLARDLDEVTDASKYLLWSDDVVVFSPPGLALPEAVVNGLEARGIQVETRGITRLVPGDDGELTGVELDDGGEIRIGTLVHQPPQRQTSLVTRLGLQQADGERVAVNGDFETSRSGIYAAGDITPGSQDVSAAVAEGASAARAMAMVLARAPIRRLASGRCIDQGGLLPRRSQAAPGGSQWQRESPRSLSSR